MHQPIDQEPCSVDLFSTQQLHLDRLAFEATAQRWGELAGMPLMDPRGSLTLAPRHPAGPVLKQWQADNLPEPATEEQIAKAIEEGLLKPLRNGIVMGDGRELKFDAGVEDEMRKLAAEMAKHVTPPQTINTWYSASLNSWVTIAKFLGQRQWDVRPCGDGNQFWLQLNTVESSVVWDVQAEMTAQLLLKQLISDQAFVHFLLTRSFIEHSPRSGLHYLFRHGRPTVAYREDERRVLAALCLHPIGYYSSSWAGALVPTDDLIASLLLMRADEHRFWKLSYQHPVWEPQAGC